MADELLLLVAGGTNNLLLTNSDDLLLASSTVAPITYTETGGAVSAGSAGGSRSVAFAEAGGATSAASGGGTHATTYNETGGAASVASGGGSNDTDTPTPTPQPSLPTGGVAPLGVVPGRHYSKRGGAIARCRAGGRVRKDRDLWAIELARLARIRAEDDLIVVELL